jgi:hypothetical protein
MSCLYGFEFIGMWMLLKQPTLFEKTMRRGELATGKPDQTSPTRLPRRSPCGCLSYNQMIGVETIYHHQQCLNQVRSQFLVLELFGIGRIQSTLTLLSSLIFFMQDWRTTFCYDFLWRWVTSGGWKNCC